VEKCPLCAQKDSQWHRLFLCDKSEFKLIREKAHKLQQDEVAKIKSGLLAGNGCIKELASAVVRVSWNNPCDPKRLWRAAGTRTQYGESLVIEGTPPSTLLSS
jgi:hypothetical protein